MAVVLFLFARNASAQIQDQTWLQDRRYQEGAGVRVGEFELHPGIGVDFGYDSNFFRRSSEENPIGSLRFRATPSFSVSTLGDQRRGEGPPPAVDFRFNVAGTYNEFIPVTGPEAEYANLREQRNFEVKTDIGAQFFRGREWSGRVNAGFTRTIRPTNNGDTNFGFNQLFPTAGAGLTWAPGSGLLDWSVGYNFSGTFFESGEFTGLNNVVNEVNTRGRWRFLPRTAMLYDGRFGFVSYLDPEASGARKTDSHPIRTRLGVNGLFTQSFGLLAMVGWGASFYDGYPQPEIQTQDFDSVIGQVEVKWYIDPVPEGDPMKTSGSLSGLSLGFIRDFEDAFIGTYLERDYGYAKFDYLFGGRFLLVVQAQGGAVVFPTLEPSLVFQANNADGWTDIRIDGNLFGEYRFTDWLGVNADIKYQGYLSDTQLNPPGNVVTPDFLAYQIVTAFLGVRAFL